MMSEKSEKTTEISDIELPTMTGSVKIGFLSPITGEVIDLGPGQSTKDVLLRHYADVIKSLLGRVEKLETLAKETR